VEVRRLLGAKAAPKPARGIEGLRAPLVGRDNELEEIRQTIGSLQAGEGSVLAILGEAGLGKSRLIAETRALIPANITWAEGRALSYSAGMSYWLVRELILSLLKVPADTALAEIAAALKRNLNGDSAVYPYLARLLELPLDAATEEQLKFLSGEALQSRILEAFRDFVRSRAQQQPLVLV
jgi:predicted ATPase